MSRIKKVFAREIIDSRATPTLEVDLYLEEGGFGRFALPSGASTGTYEALELRDGDPKRFLGKGVLKAVDSVNTKISGFITGKTVDTQEAIDSLLLEIDGTTNKSNLGANAILGVSMAFAKAKSDSRNIPLFKYIGELFHNQNYQLPRPMFNIMNGGKHANWSTDIQEFMIIVNREDYKDMLRISCEIFLHLEKLLKNKGLSVNVGNEGGFAPGFKNNEEALTIIVEAVEKAGYSLEKDVSLALDIAASEFFDSEKNKYILKAENKILEKSEWLDVIKVWINKYPFTSIEDPFAEDDWEMWRQFSNEYKDKIQIVGDDLLVTNVDRITKAINEGSCNSLLVKINQIGTLTQTINAMKLAKSAGWSNVVSHRSGETEDVSISHIAVGTGCGQIKTGAPSRGERTAKYNEIIRISELF